MADADALSAGHLPESCNYLTGRRECYRDIGPFEGQQEGDCEGSHHYMVLGSCREYGQVWRGYQIFHLTCNARRCHKTCTVIDMNTIVVSFLFLYILIYSTYYNIKVLWPIPTDFVYGFFMVLVHL